MLSSCVPLLFSSPFLSIHSLLALVAVSGGRRAWRTRHVASAAPRGTRTRAVHVAPCRVHARTHALRRCHATADPFQRGRQRGAAHLDAGRAAPSAPGRGSEGEMGGEGREGEYAARLRSTPAFARARTPPLATVRRGASACVPPGEHFGPRSTQATRRTRELMRSQLFFTCNSLQYSTYGTYGAARRGALERPWAACGGASCVVRSVLRPPLRRAAPSPRAHAVALRLLRLPPPPRRTGVCERERGRARAEQQRAETAQQHGLQAQLRRGEQAVREER